MSKSKNIKKFKFMRHSSIGAMDAYEDTKFLSKCFVDTGDINYLIDTNESKCIVVARTGAGKSALLEKIRSEEENTITLLPDELALNYIANSNEIRFFENIGIKLDIFYQLLWRHVYVQHRIIKCPLSGKIIVDEVKPRMACIGHEAKIHMTSIKIIIFELMKVRLPYLPFA